MENKLSKIYESLYKEYGSQGWWPTTPAGKQKPVYRKDNWKRKLPEKEQLEIIFGAILTQNTSWKNVEKAIVCLKQNNWINTKKIIGLNGKKLALCIRSSGYHNQKAKKLKNVSKYLEKNPIKKLFSKEINELRKDLLSVNGIGPETADSIILYAAQKPIFVIDAYTKRIIFRIGLCKKDVKYEELQDLFMQNLKPNLRVFNEFHALLVELAKQHCRTKPVCEACPVNRYCRKIY
jgi:endonuclease-3 related protein